MQNRNREYILSNWNTIVIAYLSVFQGATFPRTDSSSLMLVSFCFQGAERKIRDEERKLFRKKSKG